MWFIFVLHHKICYLQHTYSIKIIGNSTVNEITPQRLLEDILYPPSSPHTTCQTTVICPSRSAAMPERLKKRHLTSCPSQPSLVIDNQRETTLEVVLWLSGRWEGRTALDSCWQSSARLLCARGKGMSAQSVCGERPRGSTISTHRTGGVFLCHKGVSSRLRVNLGVYSISTTRLLFHSLPETLSENRMPTRSQTGHCAN